LAGPFAAGLNGGFRSGAEAHRAKFNNFALTYEVNAINDLPVEKSGVDWSAEGSPDARFSAAAIRSGTIGYDAGPVGRNGCAEGGGRVVVG